MELRKHKRRKFEAEAALMHNGINLIVATRDISQGGMLLEMQTPYKVGDVINVCFLLGTHLIEERAEIRYCLATDGSNFAGIQFLKPSHQHQALIEDYVQS